MQKAKRLFSFPSLFVYALSAPRYLTRRTLLLGVVGLCLSFSLQLLNGCVQPVADLPQPTFRIGILDALTGDDAESGRATVDAAKLAAQEINEAGGLELDGQNHLVKLVVKDTQSSAEVAVSVAQELINQENVIAIVGPQYSRYAIPVARLAEQSQIPMITPRSTNPETTRNKRYVFRGNFIDTWQGEVVARFAYEDLQARRAAVLYDIASPYNQGIAAVFEETFTEQGGEVVASETYTTGAQDFTVPLTQIRDRTPDVLFLPNYENEVPVQSRQARQLGIQSILLGADAWGGIKVADHPELDNAYFSDHYVPETDNKTTQRFIQRYRQTYGTEPRATAAATYDSLGLLFQVIQKQGSIDPESIRQGIAEFGEYHGVTGVLKYQGTGDPIVSIAILQIKANRVVFHKEIKP